MTDETSSPATGEVTTDMPRRSAADGQIIPPTARSTGTFVDLLEDGAFSEDAYKQIRKVSAAVQDIARATGNKSKGSVTITIDIASEGEALTVRAASKEKMPEVPRARSIMWTDAAGDLCRFPPNQMQMFGARKLRNVD